MTVFTFSRVPAFNPNTTPVSVARSASGSVYDIGDTGFTTPLNLTLVATNTVTTSLVSDANGMFPDFTLVDRTSVVFKSGSSLMVLTTTTPIPGPTGPASTVPGPAGPATTDASLLTAGTLADARLPARLAEGELNATYVPKWKATMAYLAGDAVLNPSGDTVTAKVNFTSGATYSATNWNISASYLPLAVDAADTESAATRRLKFTDVAGSLGSMINLWHWANGTGEAQQATYGLDIHNGIGAKQALVTHQYSNAAPAWQLDQTDSNDSILIRNTENVVKNPSGIGSGKPFVFNDHGVIRFQIFNRGEVYINPGPTAVGSGLEIVGDTVAAKALATLRHNGPAHGVVITSAAGSAGFYPLNITGQNYGANMTTATDGGAVLTLVKNGTGTGTGLTITNKGTGVTVAYRDTSALLSGITALGEFEHYVAGKGIYLRSPNNTRYKLTVADGGTLLIAAA